MKSFSTHVSWEGGMLHDNFITLPTPVLCNQCDIAVDSFSLGIVPDEPVYLGYLSMDDPFATNSKITIKVQMSNGFLYTSFHYLQQLSKDHVINEVLLQEYAKRKGALDGATFESIAKEFTESKKELPHIKFDGHTTSLEVPKNTNCELFFTNKIDIKHKATLEEKTYPLSDAKYWLPLVSEPFFGLKLQLNNNNGESKIIKYTRRIDENQHDVNNLVYTSFQTREIRKIRIQVVDPIGEVLQTIGNCVLTFKTK